MVAFNDGTNITDYRYDALGRRISKSNNSGETRYYSLGSRVIEETTSANNTSATYVYGNYIDEVLSMNRNSNNYYYHSDDIYNVMMLTNAAGSLQEDYDYNAFGAPDDVSSVGNPYLFNGREFDAESGFYNYRTRYLDPSVGRFTTRDTIGIWGDHANLGNGYTYVGNNPKTFVDPFGLARCNPCEEKGYISNFIAGVASTLSFASEKVKEVVDYVFTPYTYPVISNSGFADTLRSLDVRRQRIEQMIGPENVTPLRAIEAIDIFTSVANDAAAAGTASVAPAACIVLGKVAKVSQQLDNIPNPKRGAIINPFEGNTTRQGVIRVNQTIWRNTRDIWDKSGIGDILSTNNRSRISKGQSPIVNDSWIKYFPGDKQYKGEKIIIHHVNGGPITVPLPMSRHLDAHMPGGFRYNPGGPGQSG